MATEVSDLLVEEGVVGPWRTKYFTCYSTDLPPRRAPSRQPRSPPEAGFGKRCPPMLWEPRPSAPSPGLGRVGGLVPALPPGSGFRGRIQSISLGWTLRLPRLSEERSHKGNFSSSFSVLIVKRLFTATGLLAGQQHVPAHVL